MRLVLVEWLDSFGCSQDWSPLDCPPPTPLVCRSVGWLLHDTDEVKVVVPHVSQADHDNATPQGCGDMTIPTAAIRRIVDLDEPGPPST